MNRSLLFLTLFTPLAAHGLITHAAGQPAAPASSVQPVAPASRAMTIDFDKEAAGKVPPGWKAEGTNQKGPVSTWQVVKADPPAAPSGPNILGLTSVNHDSGGTYNVCWTDTVKFADGAIEVKVRADSGAEDQGGGPIWRVKDKDNYLIARYNPLEENFRLYYVKDGSRKQLATAKIAPAIPAVEWFTIRVEQKGNAITCFLNGKKELEATDDHITGEGGVGVWTKADAATSFDDLKIEGGTLAAGAATVAAQTHAAGGMAGKSSHAEPPLNWVARPTSAAPEIDGEIDAAWSNATPLVVSVREAVGAGSPRIVTLRALHTANPPMLYVLAEWEDDTKSDRRDPYIWNAETKAYDRPTRPDDQFALEFPISGEFDVSMLAMGKTYTADVWHWKAGRGGPIGYVDDKRHIISANPIEKANEYAFGPHGKVYIQRPMDAGTHAYAVKPKPTTHEGDEVDSFVQQQPSGSVADIRGKATHNGRGWVLEMARRLDTGNADDAVIRANGANLCAIAILDDELYWHHSVSSLIHLTFGKE